MSRRVFAVGETVFDIIFKNGKPIDAYPGGSMLNASVSLGKIDISVQLITELFDDLIGQLIRKFLKNNKVDIDISQVYKNHYTPVALAFLDDNNNASYQFYKKYPEERFRIALNDIANTDILLFGSIYAITNELRNSINQIVNVFKLNNALIIYDPNFRKPHLNELDNVKFMISENINKADIIRGSDEDFKLIFGTNDAEQTFDKFENKNNILIYTASNKGVWLISEKYNKRFEVEPFNVVSTIGAGDSFNAGLIYSIIKHDVNCFNISEINLEIWSKIIIDAISFGANVCSSYENYISDDFANDIILNK